MKKYLILLLAAAAILVSRGEYNGATQTAGALNLKDGDKGTMRAVFLPFGCAETVSANGTDFVFSKTYYAYYLTATLPYTVTDNTVEGAFNMTIPDDYVQFFIEDNKPTNGGYRLGTDAVIPVGVASIAADGSIVGYKYFNFDLTRGRKNVDLLLSLIPEGIDGTIEIMADRPWTSQGGRLLGTLPLKADMPQSATELKVPLPDIGSLEGKHAVFFKFSSPVKEKSLCQLESFWMRFP